MPKFTHDSVQRALIAHETDGRVRTWSPPEPGGRQTYRVDLHDYGMFEGSLREVHALVIGLRVGSVHEQKGRQHA